MKKTNRLQTIGEVGFLISLLILLAVLVFWGICAVNGVDLEKSGSLGGQSIVLGGAIAALIALVSTILNYIGIKFGKFMPVSVIFRAWLNDFTSAMKHAYRNKENH